MLATILDPVEDADCYRHDAYRRLDQKTRSSFGQFMTPAPIARFMASLFKAMPTKVQLLDPGAGIGALSAAFVDHAIQQGVRDIGLTAFEIDQTLFDFLGSTVQSIRKLSSQSEVTFTPVTIDADFILASTKELSESLFNQPNEYTHVIMNPPYKKMGTSSLHRKRLQAIGIETSNLYSAFLALAIKMLKQDGELVAIIPRSFCNGPYFKPFRDLLLDEMKITRVHLFESRGNVFKEDEVLQENIILHAVKGGIPGDVVVTTSSTADFRFDKEAEQFVADDMTYRVMVSEDLVDPNDSEKFIRLAVSELDQEVVEKISAFSCCLDDLGLKISTGPVVDFRLKDDWCFEPTPSAIPLLYAHNFDARGLTWPKVTKKPVALHLSPCSQKWLMSNTGCYVVTKRFSSKEEKKRVVAYVYQSDLPGSLIGFENHLNVFHMNKSGLSQDFAYGLAAFLNSTLVDKFFRSFNGHTQVNACDLRTIPYPNSATLENLGRVIGAGYLDQVQIDRVIIEKIEKIVGPMSFNPVRAHQKMDEALSVLKEFGFPKAQQNERSALTLLALIGLTPEGCWQELDEPLVGITPIMNFCRDVYKKEYAPNSRETFRRFTMHQFVDAGIAMYNPDQPDRPVNSPKACYQIAPEAKVVMQTFGLPEWGSALKTYLSQRRTLVQRYAKRREMEMIPVQVGVDQEIKLTPGKHSRLLREIIEEFAPRFIPESEVIYVGDTGERNGYFQRERLEGLGVQVDRHGKMPDAVFYYPAKNWLVLIEAVTSHGPVDSKRHEELMVLFEDAKPGLVFVSAFPDRATMARYLADISWESEVWVSSSPTHLIHFNGVRFLGPYE